MFGRFLPRETSFFDFFEQHAALTIEGTKEFLSLVTTGANIAAKCRRISDIGTRREYKRTENRSDQRKVRGFHEIPPLTLSAGKISTSRKKSAWIWSGARLMVAVEATTLGRTRLPSTSHEQSRSTAVS